MVDLDSMNCDLRKVCIISERGNGWFADQVCAEGFLAATACNLSYADLNPNLSFH